MQRLILIVAPNHAVNFREQLADLRERTDFHRRYSRERGIEAQLKAAAQRAYRDQEDAADLMVAPQDYDVHQSVRVLELQIVIHGCDQQIYLGTFLSS